MKAPHGSSPTRSKRGGSVADVLLAFERFLGTSDMLAYLAMMAPRLVELRRVLKPTGSLYLHCEPTASHYLKLLLDAVFGPELSRFPRLQAPPATRRAGLTRRDRHLKLEQGDDGMHGEAPAE